MSTYTPHPAPPALRDPGFHSWLGRHPLTAFFAWFFTVGQAFAFAPLLLRGAGVDVPVQPFILGSTLVGLLLPALVITRVVDGPDALRRMLRSAVDVRVPLRWYAATLVGLPLLVTALTVALVGVPEVSGGDIAAALVAGFALQLFLTFVPNNWWEEVAWQGFVQTRLEARHGPFLAAVLTGLLFAAQHVALVVEGGVVTALALLALLAALTIPFRFVTGWVHHRTGSLFLVGLFHGVGNAVAGGSGFGDGLLPRLFPGETVVRLSHLLAIALIGLVVVVATRGRLGLGERAR